VDSKGFLADPFANEKPLFVITAATVDKYKDKLSEGQVAMFKRYPETYKIPVYPTHRTVNLPPEIYESIKRSALNVKPINDGNGLEGFTGNRYYAFPIPKNGVEVLWNHITRYHGGNLRRIITQATPQTNGSYTPIRFEEEVAVPQLIPDMDPAKAANVLSFFKQSVTAPARLAGRAAGARNPRPGEGTAPGVDLQRRPAPRAPCAASGLRRAGHRVRRPAHLGQLRHVLRRARSLRLETGGQEGDVHPYNSYKLDSPSLKYDDIIKAGHINQDLTRYELHRVWEVIGTVKPSERHIYAKRHMYIDEDSWQVALVDHYDGRGQLWRVAEGHAQFYYDHQTPAYTVETLYDIIAGRYIALGMKNEEKSSFVFGFAAKAADYTPAALRATGVR
jgi:hypothetical protein